MGYAAKACRSCTLAQRYELPWAPMEAIAQMLGFSKQARDRLPEVNVPTLVLQSRADTTVLPVSAGVCWWDCDATGG